MSVHRPWAGARKVLVGPGEQTDSTRKLQASLLLEVHLAKWMSSAVACRLLTF